MPTAFSDLVWPILSAQIRQPYGGAEPINYVQLQKIICFNPHA